GEAGSAAVLGRPARAGRVPAQGPLGRALRTLPPRALSAEALRRTLPADTLLLDYLVFDGALHLIAVRREGLAGHLRLISEPRLAGLVHALLFDLRSDAFLPLAERAGRGGPPALADALAELAAAVLWPALAGATPRALAVVPVGPLARLPWAALPLPDGTPLCAATDLTVVPGLRLALAAGAPTGPPAGAPAVGGSGSGSGPQARRGAAPPLVVASDAGELENVGPEARAVLQAFPDAHLLAGEEATTGRLAAHAARAPWIHFAGHGLYRAQAPHESGLRLADRWLLAGEVSDLTLRSRWVTLSACQSARALVRPGEEWFGLARSFLIAGARA